MVVAVFKILLIVLITNLFNAEMGKGRQYRNFERHRIKYEMQVDSLITISAREAEIKDSILRMDVKN